MYEFNSSMSLVLNDALNRNISILSKQFNIFSDEEINSIENLSISSSENIDGISILKNLKYLKIKSEDFRKISYDVNLEEHPLVNNIKTFDEISKLKSLKLIVIENDVNIKSLDIGGLTNLRGISLKNNPNLKELIGLDNLKKLERVFICGCDISNQFNINRYIKNTAQAKANVLDISMYHTLVKDNPKMPENLDTLNAMGFTKLKFAEQVGMVDFVYIDIPRLNRLYNECKNVINKFEYVNFTDEEKVYYIHKYLVTNVDYARDFIRSRHKKFIANNYKIPNYARKNYGMIHSSYSAMVFKRSNCEGYVNLMKLLLKMIDIESFNVHCTTVDAWNTFSFTHACIRVKINDEWYYFDPSLERERGIDLSFKNLEEIKETHVLNSFENSIRKGHTNDKKRFKQNQGY